VIRKYTPQTIKFANLGLFSYSLEIFSIFRFQEMLRMRQKRGNIHSEVPKMSWKSGLYGKDEDGKIKLLDKTPRIDDESDENELLLRENA
jgi:hypothetical protein